jgi:GNAT superfamily N-acetyltransferase
MPPPITIAPSDVATAVALSEQIPEFIGPPGADAYAARLNGVPHLILVAYDGPTPVGFKVGYGCDGYFYSWLGGVLPAYRRSGIALQLAEAQEDWARQQGYPRIVFKTRNQHKKMLRFAIGRGFDIVGFKPKDTIGEHRILLEKAL